MPTNTFHAVDLPNEGRITRDLDPHFCPHCSRTVVAEELEWRVIPDEWRATGLECVFCCPNPDCKRLFVAEFSLAKLDLDGLPAGLAPWRFMFRRTWPTSVKRATFPESIRKISPQFCEIYAQAERAEAHELLEICGLGYRKAVEYLIKDFCIDDQPEKAERIKAMTLGACIKEFVSDFNVRVTAERAVWLGNDEAHYVRKWVDKDLEDMKALIRVASNWIDSAIVTRQYQVSMPQPPKG